MGCSGRRPSPRSDDGLHPCCRPSRPSPACAVTTLRGGLRLICNPRPSRRSAGSAAIFRGRHLRRGAWLCGRLAIFLSPASAHPFSSGGTAVSFHVRAVNEHLDRRPSGGRQGLEDPLPGAPHRPAHEPTVERLARSVRRWSIDPPAAGPEHVDDSADHPAIINTRRMRTSAGSEGCRRAHSASINQSSLDRTRSWSKPRW